MAQTARQISALQINRARQEDRQRNKFPPDRIAFRPEAATEDMTNFKLYNTGNLTLKALCRCVAKSNLLDEIYPDGIPEEMMLNELRITGWDRKWASTQN